MDKDISKRGISEEERILVSDYLYERRKDIYKVFKDFNIKYYKSESGRKLFCDNRDRIRLRLFYSSDSRYVSIDEWDEGKTNTWLEDEKVRLFFKDLKNQVLWLSTNGYFNYIVEEILNLPDLPIEVRA